MGAYDSYLISMLNDMIAELPDVPTLAATDLKDVFDKSSIQIKDAFNSFVVKVGADKDAFDAWKADLQALNMDAGAAAALSTVLLNHHGRHSTGGGDQITPGDIGAAPAVLSFSNVTVSTTGWATYTASGAEETGVQALGYVYKKNVALSGVTADMKVDVDPHYDYNGSGSNLWRRSVAYAGGVTLYADVAPTSAFVIDAEARRA